MALQIDQPSLALSLAAVKDWPSNTGQRWPSGLLADRHASAGKVSSQSHSTRRFGCCETSTLWLACVSQLVTAPLGPRKHQRQRPVGHVIGQLRRRARPGLPAPAEVGRRVVGWPRQVEEGPRRHQPRPVEVAHHGQQLRVAEAGLGVAAHSVGGLACRGRGGGTGMMAAAALTQYI